MSTSSPFGSNWISAVAKGLRHRVEAAAAQAGVAGLRMMPPDASSALAGSVMAVIGPRLKRSRRAHDNLARVFPDMPPSRRAVIVREMWRNAGRVGGEYPHLYRLLNDPDRVRFKGLEEVRSALSGRGAALLLSAHYGNWEMTVAAGRALGLKQANLYRSVKNPAVDALMQRLRIPTAPAGLIAKGDGNMRDIIRLLRRGISVGMLVDQRERRGVVAPFLGIDAPTAHGPALLARRVGAPIFLGVARRTDGARYELKCCHIPTPITEDIEADALVVTRRINDQLSAWIREDPAQWFWFHRRWPDDPKDKAQPQKARTDGRETARANAV